MDGEDFELLMGQFQQRDRCASTEGEVNEQALSELCPQNDAAVGRIRSNHCHHGYHLVSSVEKYAECDKRAIQT
jgi:hypothetical protein